MLSVHTRNRITRHTSDKFPSKGNKSDILKISRFFAPQHDKIHAAREKFRLVHIEIKAIFQ